MRTKECADVIQFLSATAMAIRSKKSTIVYGITPKPLVIFGLGGADFNREYCREHDIGTVPLGNSGGTIVSNTGDLNVAIICPAKQEDVGGKVQETLAAYLQNRGLNATVDKNDVLIDGKKFCGIGTLTKNGMRLTGIFIAMKDSTDLVKIVCKKPMVKKPTGL